MTNRSLLARIVTRWGPLLTAGAVLLAGVPAPLSASTNEGSDGLLRARVDIRKGDDAAAVRDLLAVLKSDPGNKEARFQIGVIYLKQGRYPEAERHFVRLAEQDYLPDQLPVLLATTYLGESKYQEVIAVEPCRQQTECRVEVLGAHTEARLALGDVAGAEADALAAHRAAPDAPTAILARARVLNAKGDPKAAEALVDGLLQRDPGAAAASAYKADLRAQAKDYDGAVASLRPALAATPNDMRLRFGLISALISGNRDAEAQGEVDAILAQSPSTWAGGAPPKSSDGATKMLVAENDRLNAVPRERVLALYLDGLLRLRAHDMPGALQAVRPVEVLIADGIPRSGYTLALILEGNGNFEQAIKYASRYHDEVPADRMGTLLLGRLFFEVGSTKRAVDLLEPLHGQLAGDADALSILGASYLAEGRFEAASQALAEAVKLRPEDVLGRAQLAVALTGRPGTRENGLHQLEQLARAKDAPPQIGLTLVSLFLTGGDYQRAVEAAALMAERQPSSPLPWSLRGFAESEMGDDAAARKDFETAAARDPNYPGAAIALAQLDLMAGDGAAARQRLDDFLKRQPANLSVLLARANLELRTGKRAAAAPFLQAAVAADPNSVDARVKLIDVRASEGEVPKAVQLAQDLANQYPDNVAMVDLAAAICLKLGRTDLGIHMFQDLVSRYPNDPAISHRFGLLLALAGQPDEARLQLIRSVADSPNDIAAWIDFASVELSSRGLDAALDVARKAAVYNPKSPEIALLVGDLYRAAGRLDEAEATYRTVQAQRPSAPGIDRLYEMELRKGTPQKALALAKSWLDTHPDDLILRLKMAEVLAATGDLAGAIVQYEVVAGKTPRDPAVLNNLALAYDRAGDRRALMVAKRAFQLAPDNPSVVDTYAYMLYRKGEGDRRPAAELLRQAYAARPESPGIAFHMAEVLAGDNDADGAKRILKPLVDGTRPFDEQESARQLYTRLGGR